MGKVHKIRPGDTVTSVAFEHGFAPATLEGLAENADLKSRRDDLNILVPGEDELVVPDRRARVESCATEARHRFRRIGVPSKLSIRFLDRLGDPRSGLEFTVRLDRVEKSGTTDDDGFMRVPMSPGTRTAVVRLIEDGIEETHRFRIGHVQPVGETSGVQARLTNLGYRCGAIDGKLGPRTRDALARFQANEGLDPTGTADDATRRTLDRRHLS